jgi:tripartite-type tricarboxylate transporter receptor subunit TctC
MEKCYKQIIICILLIINFAYAQPIEFIVSASPGGPNDTVTRKIVEVLEKNSDLQFVVFNKPGAAHTIAYTHVINSTKPTLIMSTAEIVNHDVFSYVDEVFNAGYFTNVLYVSTKSEIKDLSELARLKEVKFGHGGFGSYSHMAMKKLCDEKLKCLEVPYKSGANGMMAVMSGEIDAYALASYGSSQFMQNDKLKAIYHIRIEKDKSWFKLFTKNISSKDKDTIRNILKSQDVKFYTDMGFEK